MKKSIALKDEKLILYCRESRDENQENYERIETQRDFLLKFCNDLGYDNNNIIDIIMDDNISGTNFYRLDKIKQQIINKEVDTLVFKDSSRLGRNQMESLLFVDFAEKHGVKLLFASEDYNEDFFPLQAWFNEQRCKEDSKKIKNVIKHKMNEGTLSVTEPYGYKRIDKLLTIDEETAQVVREIFHLFLQGYGTCSIATILNSKAIPTPSQAKGKKNTSSAWTQQQIYRILSNEKYTGKMIYNKTEKISFKNKKIVENDKKEWIIFDGHHEPIITQEVFDQAQSKRTSWNFEREHTPENPRLFTGLLICGRCGSKLILRLRKGCKTSYICAKNHREGSIKNNIRADYGCKTHIVKELDLLQAVNQYIQNMINLKVDSEYIINVNRQRNLSDSNIKKYERLKSEIDKIEKIVEKIYDDKLNGLINERIYSKKSEEYNKKLDKFNDELKIAEKEINNVKKTAITKKEFDEIKKDLVINGITNNLLKKIFNKILVFLPNEITLEYKTEYNLPDEWYEDIKQNGGLLFDEKIYNNNGYIAQ